MVKLDETQRILLLHAIVHLGQRNDDVIRRGALHEGLVDYIVLATWHLVYVAGRTLLSLVTVLLHRSGRGDDLRATEFANRIGDLLRRYPHFHSVVESPLKDFVVDTLVEVAFANTVKYLFGWGKILNGKINGSAVVRLVILGKTYFVFRSFDGSCDVVSEVNIS